MVNSCGYRYYIYYFVSVLIRRIWNPSEFSVSYTVRSLINKHPWSSSCGRHPKTSGFDVLLNSSFTQASTVAPIQAPPAPAQTLAPPPFDVLLLLASTATVATTTIGDHRNSTRRLQPACLAPTPCESCSSARPCSSKLPTTSATGATTIVCTTKSC